MKKTTCKIFSDASYDHLTGKCGYGVAIVMKDLCILKYGSIRGVKSSSEAEMLAAKKGLDYLNTKEFKGLCRPVKKVVFLSDSQCIHSFRPNSKTLSYWMHNKKRGRLITIANKAQETCIKLKREIETFHIKAHTCGDKKRHEKPYHEQLNYFYNDWCDQSARKNLRYGLRGKEIIKCQGFIDPRKHNIKVPEGAAQEKHTQAL